MEDMFQELLWRKQGRPRELYPDESIKDAPVPPELPVPNCDCGRLADVFQLRHPARHSGSLLLHMQSF